MEEIELFDIKNDPPKVNRIIEDTAHALDIELYILIRGNHFEFSEDTKWILKKLAKDIQYYIGE